MLYFAWWCLFRHSATCHQQPLFYRTLVVPPFQTWLHITTSKISSAWEKFPGRLFSALEGNGKISACPESQMHLTYLLKDNNLCWRVFVLVLSKEIFWQVPELSVWNHIQSVWKTSGYIVAETISWREEKQNSVAILLALPVFPLQCVQYNLKRNNLLLPFIKLCLILWSRPAVKKPMPWICEILSPPTLAPHSLYVTTSLPAYCPKLF